MNLSYLSSFCLHWCIGESGGQILQRNWAKTCTTISGTHNIAQQCTTRLDAHWSHWSHCLSGLVLLCHILSHLVAVFFSGAWSLHDVQPIVSLSLSLTNLSVLCDKTVVPHISIASAPFFRENAQDWFENMRKRFFDLCMYVSNTNILHVRYRTTSEDKPTSKAKCSGVFLHFLSGSWESWEHVSL